MKEKDAELAAKDTELKIAQKNASDLDDQQKSRKDLADLKTEAKQKKQNFRNRSTA